MDKDYEPKTRPMACRESAHGELRRQSKRLRDMAYRLEKLADEIGELSPAAEEALYELAMQANRIR